MTKYLTNSEMSQWRRCKRKWWLLSYRGLRKRNETHFNGALGIGNRVHDPLAAYYDPEDPCTDPVAFMHASIAADLLAYPAEADALRKEEDLADAMLTGYMEWLAETGADQALHIIEAEKAGNIELLPATDTQPDVRLLAKLDARVEHEELGGRYALEHKTVSTIKPPAILRINPQFLTEHLIQYVLLKEESGGEEPDQNGVVGVLWNALLKSKRTARARGPFYAREPVRHSKDQLRKHWFHVIANANEIMDATRRLDAGEDHHIVVHPNPTNDCSWDCPAIAICALFDDGSDVEGAIHTRFETVDPLARYEGLLPTVELEESVTSRVD
jgi:hypothetical protein